MDRGQEPALRSEAAGRGYTVGSAIMMVLALALIPPLFGAVGVVLGIVGYRKGDPLGRVTAWCSAAATVIGVVLAAALLHGTA